MIDYLELIESSNRQCLKKEKWLQYLYLTNERQANIERLHSVSELSEKKVLKYTLRTLELLDTFSLDNEDKDILCETLKWCEVSKCGLPHKRKGWIEKGYNLLVHNLGSAEIYLEENIGAKNQSIIYILIKTHGLIGQVIRGEVPLKHNLPLYELISKKIILPERLKNLLVRLNECVIGAVDTALWEKVKQPVLFLIDKITKGDFGEPSFKSRIGSLRTLSIQNGENFNDEYNSAEEKSLITIEQGIKDAELWYVEAAIHDFSFREFIKIFLFITSSGFNIKHISFEPLMRALYYDYKGNKHINIYKKRLLENYLASISDSDIIAGNLLENEQVKPVIIKNEHNTTTVLFNFAFSNAAEKLIAFCVAAENSGVLYEKAIVLLFDLFGFRRDSFDRFHNEQKYLNQMNNSMGHKRVILDYITGQTIIDIGPGGGGLMDMLADVFPAQNIIGIDFSHTVVETLQKRKNTEKRTWDIRYGNALEISKTYSGGADTVIFSSVLHELFSYIEYDGKKFNRETLAAALKSAYEVLNIGGHIIIRDGIETSPREQLRILRFHSSEGLSVLKRYVDDFCGRKIAYKITGHNEVIMLVNDAMEFLYTYTWGEESYVHEVQEQFGYFTAEEYRECIKKTLGNTAQIIEFKHFLQDGYTEALTPKVSIYDENGNDVPFPDSTCIIVIEKIKSEGQ